MKELTLDQIREGLQRSYQIYELLVEVLKLLNPPRFEEVNQLYGEKPIKTLVGTDGFSPISYVISIAALELAERNELYEREREARK